MELKGLSTDLFWLSHFLILNNRAYLSWFFNYGLSFLNQICNCDFLGQLFPGLALSQVSSLLSFGFKLLSSYLGVNQKVSVTFLNRF